MQYKSDYKASREREIEAEKRLQDLKFLTENSSLKGRFTDWDLSVTSSTSGKAYTIEVKLNRTPENEAFIELGQYIENVLHPSGLSDTKASHHLLTFLGDHQMYMIKTPVLKKLIAQRKYLKTHIDRNGYLLAIFNREDLLSYCNIL